MPVFNARQYVRQAVESILEQTFVDFDFLILDDGSTDDSREIISGIDDKRIRLIKNEQNLGIAKTLNKGLSLARGEFVARMDADDIADSERLSKQYDFLIKNPRIGVCGSWVWNFNDQKKFLLRYPVGQDCVRSFFLFANPCSHPSVMMRSEMIRQYGLQYNPAYKAAQDYDLWRRCTDFFEIDNIPEPLVSWRRNEQGMTWGNSKISNEKTMEILREMLGEIGCHPSEQQLCFHREIGNGSGMRSHQELIDVTKWLSYLLALNKKQGHYSHEGLLKAVGFVWFRVCLNSSGMGLAVLRRYYTSSFRKWYRPGKDELMYFLINSIFKMNKAPTGRLN